MGYFEGNNLVSNKRRRVAIILVTFLMYYLMFFLLHPDAKFWKEYLKTPTGEIIIELSLALFYSLLISETSFFINEKLNRKISWTDNASRRLLVQCFLQLIAVLVISCIQFGLLLFFFYDKIKDEEISWRDPELWQWLTVSFLLGLMTSTLYAGQYLIANWKKTAMEAAEHKLKAAEHKQAAVEAELQALKLQIDPHFVFNNLSVLSELILTDQQLGYEYSENFSKVYRYLLMNAKKDIITLEEELKFLNAYIFLIQQRAGEGVQFDVQVDDECLHLYLPPMSLQLLIENALKHNKTIKADPLKVSIRGTLSDGLVVSNAVKPLEHAARSSGIGLSNVIERYRLLSDKVPQVRKDRHSFVVSLPLLEL
ncbi:histidine kinase [Pseudoflavitalea sp. G-6-1-2]|uniref:sensor histidine kinase n=1 Tax=Pseudoflavitalea sp. G-6-1-2 TaxID=2728841 RepID=UPI00146B8272|nr:histidine kinase [Pseudoflavitalea sp. G-6-1-2]NML20565.1 histidine kinase [Pseudoflavitalea sp. G-6-1-2]